MNRLIIIALALLTIGCKKTEAPTPTTQTQKVVVEPIEYMFSQQINSNTNAQVFDMNGNIIGVVNNYINSCLPAYFTLEDGISCRLVMNGKAPNNQYTILIWEGVVTSNDRILTYSKTGGSGNMFNDGSCGNGVYVVK